MLTEIINATPDWIIAITGLVTAASAVAALTPTKRDDKIISKILGVLRKVSNLLALNVMNAKPKE